MTTWAEPILDERYARLRTSMCDESPVDADEQTRLVIETVNRERELRKPHAQRVREFLQAQHEKTTPAASPDSDTAAGVATKGA